ncbi:hypothetical protein FALCPG4_011091 [Fusarium falciforme]
MPPSSLRTFSIFKTILNTSSPTCSIWPPPHQRKTPKSSAQSFHRFIQELQEENDLVVINSEVDPHLELAAIDRNVYETEDKAPPFNNVKGRQGNGLFRILGAPVGASKIPGKRFIRIAKSLDWPSDASGQEIIHKIRETKRLPKVPPKEVASGPVKENKV